jgi:hypothetical protein
VSLVYDPLIGGWVFQTPSGPRVLRDPDGLPTGRQLRLLAHRGLLEIRDEPAEPLTKVVAALAIEGAGAVQPLRTDAELAVDLLEAVREHPGSSWGEIRAHVHGAHARLAWIRKQLLRDGRLVIVREGQRMGLYVPEDAP